MKKALVIAAVLVVILIFGCEDASIGPPPHVAIKMLKNKNIESELAVFTGVTMSGKSLPDLIDAISMHLIDAYTLWDRAYGENDLAVRGQANKAYLKTLQAVLAIRRDHLNYAHSNQIWADARLAALFDVMPHHLEHKELTHYEAAFVHYMEIQLRLRRYKAG